MRMVSTLTLIVLLSALVSSSWADEDDFGSALIVGTGGAYAAAIGDPATIWYNPAVMDLAAGKGGFGFSYRRAFGLEALGEVDASMRNRLGQNWSFGAGFSRFGRSNLYQETRGIAGLAGRIDRLGAAGVSVSYERIEFGGNRGTVFAGATMAIGIAARPVHGFVGGVAIRHIRLDRLYDASTGDAGTLIESSLAWSADPDITIAGIWSKENGRKSRFGVGQRLRLFPDLEFLSGLRFDPIRYTLGGRLQGRSGTLNYVYHSHPDLGSTHIIGLGWYW